MDVFSALNRLKIIPFLRKWNLITVLLGAIDIIAIVLAFQCSYYISYHHTGGFFFTDKNLLLLFLGILPFWLLILYFIQVTEIPRTKRYRVLFFEYLQASVTILFLQILIYFVFGLSSISRRFQVLLPFFGFLFLFFIRLFEYKTFKNFRAKGHNQRNIILIADDSSIPFIERLVGIKEWGYKIIAIFTGSVQLKEKYEKSIILLPEDYLNVINDLMEVDIIDEVIYLKNKINPNEVREAVRSCEELGVVFNLKYNDQDNNKLTNAVKTIIGNEKFLTFINIPHKPYALGIKKIMDINVSLLMILIFSPVLLMIAVIIKFTSPGPVIYKQVRVGLRGRLFNMYKFRTMILNAEELKKGLEARNEADDPVFKIKDDPRVTKIGRFLRKTGLDELPQLINILKGEMSLIGPRPPLPEETKSYKRWQLRRLSVKPGLSCFWQIKPERNNIKFEKWMEMDLAYIDNWSLRLDFMIFLKTIRTVFKRTGL